jgi:hypothetical protein
MLASLPGRALWKRSALSRTHRGLLLSENLEPYARKGEQSETAMALGFTDTCSATRPGRVDTFFVPQ